MTNDTTVLEPGAAELPLVRDEPSAVRRALHLFGTGALGGLLTVFGLVVLSLPSQHCCGASADSREQSADVRRRCLELGVTPEQLAELDRGEGP